MIENILKSVLGEKSAGWAGMLTSKLGFSSEQANGFVPAAFEKISGLFTGGDVDVSKGLDVNALLEKLNPAELGEKVGVDASKATEGLKGMLPDVVSTLQEKAGGLDGLMSMMKGKGGGALGKLGEMFGK